MPIIKKIEDKRDLFPLKVDEFAELISWRISRFKDRQAKRIEE